MVSEMSLNKYKEQIQLLRSQTALMTEIFDSALKNYGIKETTKLYRHRQLCLGSLLIARQNAEAAYVLLEQEITYPVHYISRSMFELVVNLYYILDKEEERDWRLDRYVSYSDAVLPYKILEILQVYPELFPDDMKNPQRSKQVADKYSDFDKKYKNGSRFKNYWSGMNLRAMIEKLSDPIIKREMLVRYKFVTNLNNTYLHPSWFYIKDIAKHTIQPQISDYQDKSALVATTFESSRWLIKKILENFPKGRPAFLKHGDEISAAFYSIKRVDRQ